MITALLLPLFLLGAPAERGRPGRPAAGDDPADPDLDQQRPAIPARRPRQGAGPHPRGWLPAGAPRRSRRPSAGAVPLDPRDDNFVRGGRKYEIRGRGGRESFTADDGKGTGTVYAAVSHDPFRFDQFVLGDHWDYRKLAPQRLPVRSRAGPQRAGPADGGRRLRLRHPDLRRARARGLRQQLRLGLLRLGYYEGRTMAAATRTSAAAARTMARRTACRSACSSAARYCRHYYDPFYRVVRPVLRSVLLRPLLLPSVLLPAGVRIDLVPVLQLSGTTAATTNRYRGWNGRTRRIASVRPTASPSGYRDRRYDLRRSVNTVYMPPIVRDRQPRQRQSDSADRG